MDKIKLGKIGESMASEFLRETGIAIIDKNYRCKKGEIDIIGLNGKELVFVEVKTRTSLDYGTPAESINEKKLERIYKVGEYYKKEKKYENYESRVDIVEIIVLHRKDM